MRIPHRDLSPEALNAVIEEYVTRDGTELTESGVKASEVARALDRGVLVLVFDPELGSCNLLPSDEVS